VKRFSFIAVLFLGCSGVSFNDAPKDSDPDARALLPHDIGVFITESATTLDAAAIETIASGTHVRTTITGVGLDTDMQLRRVVDSDRGEHIFTLEDTYGVVVERDRSGRSVGTKYDVSDPGKPAAHANPLDLALDSRDRLWITRHGEKSLMVFELGGPVVTTIDLSAFADDDGTPDMSAIAIIDHTAYVALRRLEKGFGTTKNTSTVVAIDTDTFAVRPFVDLPAKDPGAKFRLRNGALFISCIGGPLLPEPDRNAALVRIDLVKATATKVIDGDKVGAFVTAFDIVDDRGYAVLAEFGSDNPTSVVRFDVATGTIDTTWLRSPAYRFWDIVAVRGTTLLVADRTPEAPGLRVLSTEDGATLGKIPTKLPPVEALVLYPPES